MQKPKSRLGRGLSSLISVTQLGDEEGETTAEVPPEAEADPSPQTPPPVAWVTPASSTSPPTEAAALPTPTAPAAAGGSTAQGVSAPTKATQPAPSGPPPVAPAGDSDVPRGTATSTLGNTVDI